MRKMTRWAAIRVRLYLPDANPLRRRADRIEAVVVAALLALGVLAVLPAVLLGLHVHERATADARAGRWVDVRVVEPAGGMYGLPTVTWERADGSAGRAVAPMPEGTAGRRWVDVSESLLAPAPPEPGGQALVAGAMALAGYWALLGVAYGFARYLLDRARQRAWATAWAAADSRWNRRRA